ncbi:MAG: bifunctional 3,4-dihydroxy-2-butanone-4-phosphate synthase/GTP cyclohydrolase II, partial [Actinomycetia bacterium]|nr:bifunctional 3,4-dihydroxy-2-butanone-4-phosphate synthase/GTP cyclohydrolase II [Actinomycetes bacterium]
LDNTVLSYHFHEKVMENVDEKVELSFPEGLRDYGIGAQILVDLGLHKIRLLTNNPKKIIGLEGYGLEISGRIPIEVEPRIENIKFLKTKRDKLGHLILKDEKDEAND